MRGAALAALLAAACGTTPSGAPASAPRSAPDDSNPVALIPSGSDALLTVDVSRLRKTTALKRILDTAPGERERLKAQLGFDPIEDVDLAVASVYGIDKPEGELVLVLRGRFDVEKTLRAFMTRVGVEAKPGEHRGSRLIDRGSETVGFVTPQTLVFGSRTGFRRAVDRAWGIGGSIEDDAELAAAWRGGAAVGDAVVRGAMTLPDAMRTRQAQAGEPDQLKRAVAEIRRVSGRVDLEDGIDLSLIAEVGDAKNASRVERDVQAQVRDARQEPGLAALGLATFLDPVTVLAQGSRVLASYRLNQVRFDELLGRVGQLLEFRRRMMQGGGPPSGGPPG